MNNTNESGRSMVEMLGVLAIIGVLSVMGIAGYTQAMKKYKANEAAQEITIASMMCGTTGSIGGFQANYVNFGNCSNGGVTITGYKNGADADGVPASVAGLLNSAAHTSANLPDTGLGVFTVAS